MLRPHATNKPKTPPKEMFAIIKKLALVMIIPLATHVELISPQMEIIFTSTRA